MAEDLSDINDFSGRVQSQIDLIQDLDDQRDAGALVAWSHRMDVADTTLIDRLKNVRLLADRGDTPLVEMDHDDVMELLAAFGDGSHPDVPDDGLASGTLRQYRQAARLFFRDQLDRDWGADIEIGQPEPSPVSMDQILTADEVDALLDAAEHPMDSALIAFLTVTGQRITATLTIERSAVELDGQKATVRLNTEAKGLKGASGPRPLLWARSHVARWLDAHPVADDDAPLFCATQSGERPHEDGHLITWSKGDPLSRTQAANRLRRVAERADVPREKVKPHNFRHTAITRMRDEGIPDDRIRWMVGVAEDSNILERYDQAENAEMLARIRADHGMTSEDPAPVGRPSLTECEQCETPLRESASFCPNCGEPLDVDAAASIDERKEDVEESIPAGLADFDSEDVEDLLAARDMLDNPAIRELLDSHS